MAQATGITTRSRPWNFALDYQWRDDLKLRAFALHGEEIGAVATLSLNPKNPSVPGGSELAPLPVAVRPAGSAADLGWTTQPGSTQEITATVDDSLGQVGIDLQGLAPERRSAHISIWNNRYDANSQAFVGTLRSLSQELPAFVEMLHVTRLTKGMPAESITQTAVL